MKGDFTRNTFDSRKHYEQVLMQQGRVQLDADWNEQTSLAARRDETTTNDVVGDCGGPADGAAFGVLVAAPAGRPAPGPGDFYLSAGRYYVDGLQCELEAPVLYTKQPDRLDVAALPAGNHLLVLDVWSRHLTALDDDAMREQALGGPDTATRAKIVWQVRAFALGGAVPTCAVEPAGFTALKDPGTARLTAKTAAAAAPTDPCQVPENGGYTGLENQLYRVEIHEPSTTPGGASWKWCRENGSVVVAVEKIDPANAKRIFVSSVGADKETLGFTKGDFVELLDDANELESTPGQIVEVDDVDRDARVITLKTAIVRPAPAKPEGVDAARHPKLRRWQGFEKVQVNQFKLLEFSVQVRFDGGAYRTGHYWQIPARAATARSQRGEIEWPNDGAANPQPLSLAPRGITHHFCKLGVINVSAAPALAVSVTSDCRCLWPALTLVPRLFYLSGDGQEVMPDLTNTTGQRYPLPQPLIVGLGNGHCAPAGTKVRFTIILGDGRLTAGGPLASTIDVPVTAAGLAQCNFHLDGNYPAHYSQRAQAQLLDATGAPCSLPIIFNATLSVAREVAYNPGTCAALQGRKNVQDAISSLAALVRLDKVGGDGQDTEPGAALVNPIRVLVASSCGPVNLATVTFTVVEGFVAGGSTGIPSFTTKTVAVSTNSNGIAECRWRTATAPSTQQLRAEITQLPASPPALPPALAMGAHREVQFTANLRGGGGCCVSVGEGGDFADLKTAIETLLDRNVQDICICLLPGDHNVANLRLMGIPDIRHLHIHGCGRASRIVLTGPFEFIRVPSTTLRDLSVYSFQPWTNFWFFQECREVTITGCELKQEGVQTNLLRIDLARRIHIADNVIEARPVHITAPTETGVSEVTHATSRSPENLRIIAEAAAAHLASKSKSERAAFLKEFRRIIKDTPRGDPKKKVLQTALKRITTTRRATRTTEPTSPESSMESSVATATALAANLAGTMVPPSTSLPVLVCTSSNETTIVNNTITGEVAIGNAGVVSIINNIITGKVGTQGSGKGDISIVDNSITGGVSIADANADVSIVDNIITGEVLIYGTSGGADGAVFDNLASRIKVGRARFENTSTRSLRLEGNSLTRVVVDSQRIPVENGAMVLIGLFARMSVLDNTFHAGFGNQWLAAHVISNGNHFLVNAIGITVATAAGDSFICTGTSANHLPVRLEYGVPTVPPNDPTQPPRFNESANLIALTSV